MMKRPLFRASFVPVFALVALAVAPAGADDPAPANEPASLIACAEIASFAQLQQDVTALGAAIGQPMLAMGLLGAGQLVASPGMLGIDRDKPIRIGLFGDVDALFSDDDDDGGDDNDDNDDNDDDDDDGTVLAGVIALPLSDADGTAYFQSVATSGTLKSDADGYRVYDLRNVPLGDTLEVVVSDGYAFLSSDGDIPEAELRAIAARGADALAVPGLRGTVRLAGPATLLATPLRKGIDEAKKNIANELSFPENDETAAAVGADIDYLLDLVSQHDTLSVGLGFDAGTGLSVWTRADARPGSDAAALLALLRTPEDGVLSILDGGPDDAFAFAFGVDPALLQRAYGGFARLVSLGATVVKGAAAKAGDKAPAGAAQMFALFDKLAPMIEKSKETLPLFTGSIGEVGSFSADGDIAGYRYAIGCTDYEAVRRFATESQAELATVAPGFFSIEELETREAGGLVVHRNRVNYDLDKLLALAGLDEAAQAAASADPNMKMLREMYDAFGRNTIESTARDGVLYAIWAPGDAPLDSVLAKAASGSGRGGVLDALFADVPELSSSVLREYVDYAKVLPIVLKQLPEGAVDPDDEEFKAVLAKVQSTPDRLGLLSWRDGDSLLGVLRIEPSFFGDMAAFGQYQQARFRREWEERMRQQQQDDDDDDFEDGDDDDDPLAGLSEEDRKKIGVILDEKGDFDDNK